MHPFVIFGLMKSRKCYVATIIFDMYFMFKVEKEY